MAAVRWFFTVWRLMLSSCAISSLLCPFATSWRISSWRGLTAPPPSDRAMPRTARSRYASATRWATAGRSATVAELAQATGLDEERVLDVLAASDAYRTLSLDEPLGDGATSLDLVGGDDDGYERAEARAMLHDGIIELPAREREILRLRFIEGLTQREIAEEVGISQMHVSRLIRRTVERLRERIAVPAAA